MKDDASSTMGNQQYETIEDKIEGAKILDKRAEGRRERPRFNYSLLREAAFQLRKDAREAMTN